MEINVIVVNVNRPIETKQTIKALLLANDDIRIILINNGSKQPINIDDPKVKVINLRQNLGQAKAVNIGLREVKSEYVCCMHNDIIVKDKNWIDRAVDFLKANSDAGLVDVFGWKLLENNEIKRYTSMKGHEQDRATEPPEDFTEVNRTDEMANVFRNDGLWADERYQKTCLGIWIDILARKQKLYVIKLEDATHLRTHEANERSQKLNRTGIRLKKLKEAGLACYGKIV